MKKLLLMIAVAFTLLMGSSVFAQSTSHELDLGWNIQEQNHQGDFQFLKVRRAAPRPPRHQHCHQKRVRVRRGHHRGGHGYGHRRHRPHFKWVTYCHSHRKNRRGNRRNRRNHY